MVFENSKRNTFIKDCTLHSWICYRKMYNTAALNYVDQRPKTSLIITVYNIRKREHIWRTTQIIYYATYIKWTNPLCFYIRTKLHLRGILKWVCLLKVLPTYQVETTAISWFTLCLYSIKQIIEKLKKAIINIITF